MIDNLILIGDIVTLSIDPESRAWGCNPYPDGTVATVIGFGESTWGRVGNCGLKPGTHLCRSAVKCRLEDGRVETASSVNVELQDSEEYARRKAGYKYNPDRATAVHCHLDWLDEAVPKIHRRRVYLVHTTKKPADCEGFQWAPRFSVLVF